MPIDGYLRFVVALVFVLALIAGLAWLYRRYGQGRLAAPRRRPGRSRRRLGIVEAVALDSRRRLVLVRRDDREHLIIVGTQGETVVESGILADDGETLREPWSEPARRNDRPGPEDRQAGDEARTPDRRGHGPSHSRGDSFLRLVRQTTREPS